MGRFEMEDVMMTPGLDNLHLITAGATPPNPSELLGTPQMAEFIRQVRERYDIVLFDTPPVLPVADPAILASQVDGVLLTYQAGKVGRVALRRAKIHLENARGRVWGVVLNDIRAEISGYTTYHHYYTHYYTEDVGAGEGPGLTRFQRILGRLGSIFSRRTTQPETRESGQAIGPAGEQPESPVARGRSYSHFWLGFALILLLAAILAGLLMWRFGLWSPTRSGSILELLRARLSQQAAPKEPSPAPPLRERDATPLAPDAGERRAEPPQSNEPPLEAPRILPRSPSVARS